MPKNRLIYVGVLVVAATALIFVAHWITDHVQWILPWMLGVGIVMIIAGIAWEAKKGKAVDGMKPGEQGAQSIKDTGM